MSNRLRVTVEESQRVFQNLREDLRIVYQDTCRDFDAMDDTEDVESRNETHEATWKLVDEEFRQAYEMSRFGLDVTDLDGYADNLEVFRLNCEDVNGIDPQDEGLLRDMIEQEMRVEVALRDNAECRRSIPMNAEIQFTQHIGKMRNHFDKLEANSHRPPPHDPVKLQTDIESPDELRQIVAHLTKRTLDLVVCARVMVQEKPTRVQAMLANLNEHRAEA